MSIIDRDACGSREDDQQDRIEFEVGACEYAAEENPTPEVDEAGVACERVGDLEFHFLAGDFFQNNPFILPLFTDYVACLLYTSRCV